MKRIAALLIAVSSLASSGTLSAAETAQSRYNAALDQIHAFSGSGNELDRAMATAEKLSQSDPASGYSQTLLAEALSTWQLSENGEPAELREEILKLADEALTMNPKLAQAHVAKARVYMRASQPAQAESELAAAFATNPRLDSAIFIRAEMYRRAGDLANGEAWYRKFIEAAPHPARKSNGFYWIGKMYQDAAYRDARQRDLLISKARTAYEQMMKLDPNAAWKAVNFAIFLNEYAADFDEAERQAQKALSLMEFPMARYHLAAARFQKLQAKMPPLDAKSLAPAIAEIESSTHVSLDEAMKFRGISLVSLKRLMDLRSRADGKSSSPKRPSPLDGATRLPRAS